MRWQQVPRPKSVVHEESRQWFDEDDVVMPDEVRFAIFTDPNCPALRENLRVYEDTVVGTPTLENL
jgi:hypothetical protein